MATKEQVKEFELLDALFGLHSDPVYQVPEESREFGVHPLDRLLELYDALLAKSISALKGVGHQ